MLVVKKDTEKTLATTLHDYWENNPTYRCLHLRLSTLEENTKEWHTLLIYHLKELLSRIYEQAIRPHDIRSKTITLDYL